MISVSKGPAEKDLGLGDGASCTGQNRCLFVDRANMGVIGVDAGSFHAPEGCPGGCGGSGCWVFLYQDSSGWHYVNARCAQAPGYVPGQGATVYVSGCADVRANPGPTGQVVGCLPNGTTVNVDGAPLYTDGSIWWHLQSWGWMAHDFLVAPKNVP